MEEQNNKTQNNPAKYENDIVIMPKYKIYAAIGVLTFSALTTVGSYRLLQDSRAVISEQDQQMSALGEKMSVLENKVLASEIISNLDLYPALQVVDPEYENTKINEFIKETSCGSEVLIPKKGPRSGKHSITIDVYSKQLKTSYGVECYCDVLSVTSGSTELSCHMPRAQAMKYLARRNINPF